MRAFLASLMLLAGASPAFGKTLDDAFDEADTLLEFTTVTELYGNATEEFKQAIAENCVIKTSPGSNRDCQIEETKALGWLGFTVNIVKGSEIESDFNDLTGRCASLVGLPQEGFVVFKACLKAFSPQV